MTARVGLYPSSGRGGVLVVLAFVAALGILSLSVARTCDGDVAAPARHLAAGCAGMMLLTLYLLSRRVVADAHGVRRHDLLGTRRLTWDSVITATLEPATAGRRARIALTSGDGSLLVPADPALAATIRARAPRLAPALAGVPTPGAAAWTQLARGLELWLVAVQAAGAASIASTLLPGLEARLAAGAALLAVSLAWAVGIRSRPWLLRSVERRHRPAPAAPLRLLAGAGEDAAALVLLVILVNVAIGAAGAATLPADPPRPQVLAGVDVPVLTVRVANRDLAIPASMAPGCEARRSGLTCLREDGWITVDRDETDEGLLGGGMLRQTALFRRDALRLDSPPHLAIAWYAAGTLAGVLGRDPPDALVDRPDGDASFFWRRRDRARALVASGGEMLSVDVKGLSVRDETLLPLLGSIRASGSDLRCRWAGAAARLVGGDR